MTDAPLFLRFTQENTLIAEQHPLMLPANAAHVWIVDVQMTDYHTHKAVWMTHLTSEEGEQAHRYINPTAHMLFVVGRCVLRHLLSRYLGIPATAITLHKTPSGKPFLESNAIQFNMSHSGERVACAFSHHPIGIDLEHQRPVANMGQIVARHYSSPEIHTFQRLPFSEQSGAFFRLWTSKEAVVKGVGSGIMDLNRFTIPSALIQGSSQPQKTLFNDKMWWIYPFLPAEGYSGAFALPIEHAAITLYDLHLRSL